MDPSYQKVTPILPYTNIILNNTGKFYRKIGDEVIQENNLCVLILCGGQGTRLGSADPKGCYVLPDINHSIFSIHMQQISSLGKIYSKEILLLVMVSEFTDHKTEEYFKVNQYFGLKRENIVFFKQESCICKDFNENPYFIDEKNFARSPNGNGGLFKAMKDNDIFSILRKRNIEFVNVISVDNVLARVLDPIMIGCYKHHKFDVLSKSVDRLQNENVGIFVMKDQKIIIKEYSEVNVDGLKDGETQTTDTSTSNSSSANSSITEITSESSFSSTFGENPFQANICNHIFSVNFMENISNKTLPIHRAVKKIPYFEGGKIIKPKEPNGFKDEYFIFDCFVFSNNCGVMNVPRLLEFSPLKNGYDKTTDNPRTCVDDISKRSRLYMEKSGAKIVNCRIFVLPKTSVFGENLERFQGKTFKKDEVLK
ncbi:UDP-N-acetylglucosamine pyrophosphorylase [Hamiltosporidium tvaerminnensis]|nr:UDP-N-acetylglucosamine pyrophosphorylase [Hamiltosporidium tvaerminnensis]